MQSKKKMIIAEPWRKYALSESLLVSSVFVFSVVTSNAQINHTEMQVWQVGNSTSAKGVYGFNLQAYFLCVAV